MKIENVKATSNERKPIAQPGTARHRQLAGEIGQFVYLFSLVALNLNRHYRIHGRKAYYLFDYSVGPEHLRVSC